MNAPVDPIAPLAFTPGEPAGIGPDLCVQFAQKDRKIALVAVCDPSLLHDRARHLGLPLDISVYDPPASPVLFESGRLSVLPIPTQQQARPGTLSTVNAAYVLETLRLAANGCSSGKFSALVTGPVHKGVINESGIPFTGHTEFLAELTGGSPVMMLACPEIRVALATTHLPLREVSDAVTRKLLIRVITILHEDLVRRFKIPSPRILVCGLNPHAGENGHLGTEEITTIIPALEHLRTAGFDLTGPLPADTLFTPRNLQLTDVVLAMFHDQGLPVLKHKCFGNAVNVTLGLPIIRTSVDHGTAIDMAGSGKAHTGSLEAALAMAWDLATPEAQ